MSSVRKSRFESTAASQPTPSNVEDESSISNRRYQIFNEAFSKLHTCRAMADIICFEKDMPDSLDEETVDTLKFQLWETIGEVATLIDCAEFK